MIVWILAELVGHHGDEMRCVLFLFFSEQASFYESYFPVGTFRLSGTMSPSTLCIDGVTDSMWMGIVV